MSDRKFIYKGYYLAENGMSFAGDIGIYANQDYNKGVYWFDNDTNDTLFELRTRDGLGGKELFLTSESGLMRFVPPVVFEDDVIYKGELIDPYFDFFKGDYFSFNKQALFTEDVSIQQGKSIYWFAGENNKRFFNMQVKTIDDDCQLVFCSDTATSYINFALPVMFSGDIAYKDEFLDTILDRKLEAADLEDYALRSEVNAKQDQLTDGQLLAVNSGITTSHIAKYDAYATSKANASDLTTHTDNATVHITAVERTAWNGKQDALNSDQLAAANSGITSAKLTSINSKLEALEGSHFIVVDTLPATGETNTIYLVPSAKSAEKNVKDEYIYVNNAWEKIGSTDIDLSDYLKSADAAKTYQTKLSETQLNAANSGITSTKVNTYDSYATSKANASELTSHTGNTTAHITADERMAWDGKQNALTDTQLSAVNSGINSTKVGAYDAYATSKADASTLTTHIGNTIAHVTSDERTAWNNKQAKLSDTQLAATNSGITSTKVTAYDGYATTIASKANASDLTTHTGNTTVHITATERTAWNNKQTALTDPQMAAVNSGITSAKVTKYDNFFDGDTYSLDKDTYIDGDFSITQGKSIYWFAGEDNTRFFNTKVVHVEDGYQLIYCSDGNTSYINFDTPIRLSGDVCFRDELLDVTLDRKLEATDLEAYALKTDLTAKQDKLSTEQLAAANSGITASKVTAYDGYASSKANTSDLTSHTSNTTAHITAAERTAWNSKQDALNTNQLAAANSGITSTKVGTYDGYGTSKANTSDLTSHTGNTTVHITADERTAWNAKQAALSATQMNAVNSGITSTKVSTYDGYATTIGNKQDKLTDTQLAAVNSGITSTKVTTYDNFLNGDIYDFDKESYFEDDIAIVESKGIYWFASNNKTSAFFDIRVQDGSESAGKQLVVCSDSPTSYVNFAVPVKFSGSVSYNGELLENIIDNMVDKSELSEYALQSTVENYLSAKQDKLIVGNGIKITGNTISVDDTPKAPLMLPVYDRYMLNCDGSILIVKVNDNGTTYTAHQYTSASSIADYLNSQLPAYIEAYTNGTVLIIDVTQPGHRNITVTENNWGYEFEHFTWPDGITLKHKAVYTIPVINSTLDISGYEPEKYGTTEIWLDFVSGSVITGSNWVWTSGSSPSTWSSNKRYCLILRNDGLRTLANIDYSYTCSKSDNPIFSATPIIKK